MCKKCELAKLTNSREISDTFNMDKIKETQQ